MRIAFVSYHMPDPNGGGSPQRAANHLQALLELGEVTLIVPQARGQSPSGLAELPGLKVLRRGPTLPDLRLRSHQGARSRLARAWHAWRRLHYIDARASKEDLERFARELPGSFDLVFAGRLASAVWWESLDRNKTSGGEVRVVDFDDIESRVLAKWVESISYSRFWMWKLRRQVEWLKRVERRVAQDWDAVCLCSRLDADRLVSQAGVEPWIVPNAYAFEPISPEPPALPCQLLFVGTFSYFPNAEGVLWFVKEIWPAVRAELGEGVELTLVGLSPTPEITALGEVAGITVAGNVPSVDPYYDAANIVIAPLQAGSGTRIKLIEAAAKGRAIVTTALGCEGLGFVDGIHAEIADDPADFAARIVALARGPGRREQLVGACRAFAEASFSQETVKRDLQQRIRDIVARPA